MKKPQVDLQRITNAFSRLQKRAFTEHGGTIFTESGYLCCQNCALAELENRMVVHNAVRNGGIAVIGYVFYHGQDKLDCDSGHDLHLSYGGQEATMSYDDNLAGILTSAKVGNMLTECLREEGLTVEWDGRTSKRICVKAV